MVRCFSRAWRTAKLAVVAGACAASLLGAAMAGPAEAKGRRDGKSEDRAASTPVMAVVSIDQQRISVYDADGRMLQSPISTGKRGYETPPGVYTVLQKKVEHYSNIYYDAAMPYMQRLTWSGIALHAGVLPGYPASGGCVRMPMRFAKQLYRQTKLGTRVIVVRNDIAPTGIAHPALFKPLSGEIETVTARLSPAGAADAAAKAADGPVATDAVRATPRQSLRSIAAAKAAEAEAASLKAREARSAAAKARVDLRRLARPLRKAMAGRARAERETRTAERRAERVEAGTPEAERALEAKAAALADLSEAEANLQAVEAQLEAAKELAVQRLEEAKAAVAAEKAASEEAREAGRKLLPVSVFISRKTQRLYVRQDHEPLFESPVAITEAESPLGTYVFTALAYTDASESDLHWQVISMYRSASEPLAGKGKRERPDRDAPAAPTDLAGARLALDRIAIPKQAVERISEIVTPGSSLIVSDEGISRETGKGTGFIVVMSNEPQGGIKIRRRRPSRDYTYRRYNRSPRGWNTPFLWWD